MMVRGPNDLRKRSMDRVCTKESEDSSSLRVGRDKRSWWVPLQREDARVF